MNKATARLIRDDANGGFIVYGQGCMGTSFHQSFSTTREAMEWLLAHDVELIID